MIAGANAPAASPVAVRTREFKPRLTYAIAPPSVTTSAQRRREIANAQSARFSALPIDALLIYDVQDESARNATPRPFPFVQKIDPLSYALKELQLGAIPLIVYKAVAEQDEESLRRWLDQLDSRGGHAVLVGAPARHVSSPVSLSDALSVCRKHAPELSFGGVVIPERHQATKDEDARVWGKTQQGCRFFVSQTVWSIAATARLLRDLRIRSEAQRAELPPILFTFSPCGSVQTLRFLEWLGVEVPPGVERELLSANDMLDRSIDLAVEAASELLTLAEVHGLSVGFNIESVSSRAAEVDASVELLQRIEALGRRSSTIARAV